MAIAWQMTKEVPQPPVLKQRVQLELSLNEAETLSIVLAKIAGNATSTRRKYTDSISGALRDAGIFWTCDVMKTSLGNGRSSQYGITFVDEFLDTKKD